MEESPPLPSLPSLRPAVWQAAETAEIATGILDVKAAATSEGQQERDVHFTFCQSTLIRHLLHAAHCTEHRWQEKTDQTQAAGGTGVRTSRHNLRLFSFKKSLEKVLEERRLIHPRRVKKDFTEEAASHLALKERRRQVGCPRGPGRSQEPSMAWHRLARSRHIGGRLTTSPGAKRLRAPHKCSWPSGKRSEHGTGTPAGHGHSPSTAPHGLPARRRHPRPRAPPWRRSGVSYFLGLNESSHLIHLVYCIFPSISHNSLIYAARVLSVINSPSRNLPSGHNQRHRFMYRNFPCRAVYNGRT